MTTFIFIIGLLIGISAFLYLYWIITEGRKKISKLFSEKDKAVKEYVEPENIGFRGIRSISPGERICPLCGSILTKYEGLYATKIIENSEKKILIMGCKYCFKDD
jgi:3-dehydroquinate synthase class II